MKYHVLDVFHFNAEQVGKDKYIIRLSNGKQNEVVEHPKLNGTTWAWRVDSQYFSKDSHALSYLKRLVNEKLTGTRIIYHKKMNVPELCGVDGAACRCPGECNRALCMDCPVAEAFFAERDGVKLVYAV